MGHTQIARVLGAIMITAIMSGCVVMPFVLMEFLSLSVGEGIFVGGILGYVSGAFCGYALGTVVCGLIHLCKRVAGILCKPPVLTHEQLRHKRQMLLKSGKSSSK